LGLLNLLTGVFIKALLDITDENRDREETRLNSAKRRLLRLMSTLFSEFDIDKGGILDDNECNQMLEASHEYIHLLEQVGLPYEKLRFACSVADHSHYGRVFNRKDKVMTTITEGYQPIVSGRGQSHLVQGADLEELEFTTDEVPQGITEAELIDCLLTMDQPTVRGDIMQLSKTMMLTQRRVRHVERELGSVKEDIREILCLLRGDSPPSRKTEGGDSTPANSSTVVKDATPLIEPDNMKTNANSFKGDMSDQGLAEGESMVDADQFRSMASVIFERYDTDQSGTVNSPEELKQMSLNLIYKLQSLGLTHDTSDRHLVSRMDYLDSLDTDKLAEISAAGMDFDAFVEWFVRTFDVPSR